jgi:hypothetical protein
MMGGESMEDAKIQVSADNRRHERFRVDTTVKYKVINRQAVEELVEPRAFQDDGKSVNISLSGISIATEVPLRKGDYLKVELSLPGSARATRALAEVMWSRLENGLNMAGIRFLIVLNEADDNSIRRFVESLR